MGGQTCWKGLDTIDDEDNFNSLLGSALRLCAASCEPEALQWAEDLWKWSGQFESKYTIYTSPRSTFVFVLETFGLRDRVDALLSPGGGGGTPDRVLLGSLVSAAGKRYDPGRVEELWSRITGELAVAPHVIATTARAKAHLLCGFVHNVDLIASGALTAGVLEYRIASSWIQATLVMYHSSLKRQDLKRLTLALSSSKYCMTSKIQSNDLEKAVSLSKRLKAEPQKVQLSELLMTLHGKQSRMASWPGTSAAGSNYVFKLREN